MSLNDRSHFGNLLLVCPLDLLFKVRLNSPNSKDTLNRLMTNIEKLSVNVLNKHAMNKIGCIIDMFSKSSESSILVKFDNRCADIICLDHVNGHVY